MGFVAVETVFVLIWAFGFISVEIALADAGPFTTLTIRLWLAAALLLPFLLRARHRFDRRRLSDAVVQGLMAQAFWLICIYQSQALGARPGEVALIAALQPLATAALAGWAVGERTEQRHWLGLALGLAGTALVIAPGAQPGGSLAPGHLLAAGAAITMTVAVLHRRRRGEAGSAPSGAAVDGFAQLAVQFVTAALLITPIALFAEGWTVDWTPLYALNMVWQVTGQSIASFGLLWWLLDRSSAVRVSSLFYFTPPVTMLLGYLAFGDRVDWLDGAGMGLALVGLILVRMPISMRFRGVAPRLSSACEKT